MGLSTQPFIQRCCLILLLLSCSVSLSQSVDDAQQAVSASEEAITRYQTIQEALEQELSAIEAELGETSLQLENQLLERERLSRRVSDLRLERSQLEDEITILEREIVMTTRRQEELNLYVEDLKVRLQALMLDLHKQRSSNVTRLLAEAESFFEYRLRQHYLSKLTEQDTDLVEELNNTLLLLQEEQQRLISQIQTLSAREASLAAVQAEVEQQENELDSIIVSLNASRQGQLAQRESQLRELANTERLLSNAVSERARNQTNLEAALTRARELEAQRQAELAELERQRQLAEQQGVPVPEQAEDQTDSLAPQFLPSPALSTGFIRPVANADLVRRYGVGDASVDLRAPASFSAVQVVKTGIVLQAGFLTANSGSMVVVQHADNPDEYSAYTNLQNLQIAKDDTVVQGQVIGFLGGGGLKPSDVLEFRLGRSQGAGVAWVDPSQALGY